jgi:hypothetical protein
MLRDVLKGEPKVDVVKLQRSGGVVSRNVKVRQKARSFRIRVTLLFHFLISSACRNNPFVFFF